MISVDNRISLGKTWKLWMYLIIESRAWIQSRAWSTCAFWCLVSIMRTKWFAMRKLIIVIHRSQWCQVDSSWKSYGKAQSATYMLQSSSSIWWKQFPWLAYAVHGWQSNRANHWPILYSTISQLFYAGPRWSTSVSILFIFAHNMF